MNLLPWLIEIVLWVWLTDSTVNISAKMREEITNKYAAKDMEDIFYNAMCEVGILMERNLWTRFQVSAFCRVRGQGWVGFGLG